MANRVVPKKRFARERIKKQISKSGLSVRRIAKRMNINEWTLRTYLKTGEIPVYRYEDLIRAINQKTIEEE